MPEEVRLSEVLLDYMMRYGLTDKAREYLRQRAEEEIGSPVGAIEGHQSR
ncbi:hypothetical protein [Salipiger sp. CCB-MM3]|nr:hypothetical protein [Salipiger sp. CCB-MM3]